MVVKFLSIQHRLNPLHIYCRFLDRGLGKNLSAKVCRSYEILIFIWINWTIKVMVHLCCIINSSCRIQEDIRKC